MHSNSPAATLGLCVCAVLLLQGCNSTTHNELMGIEEVTVNGHTIVVTDCYRWGKQQPQTIEDAPGKSIHRFNPCRDADILLKYEELIVNGKSYGMLSKGDRVTLDHHKVLINDKEAREIASK
jgi:hypothetical protein